ncbi:LacI family transcriptional regulator [Bacillaceae bacterium SIJ1]|uniref:LacI family DNA-binding transcriptional regulator n=1 Tax=Litoribacterium kuwaitense TaxID=1398745 RepID=UPI0013EBB1BC|nr:LacI family DNA-binding transcriptional regulator [Litoribacterium kuwaitense]NGP46842.1 LacI family transcriptional regulator [Litoribacterium kuwaitense]
MATITEVAKLAGVSKGTVSNVFSGKRPISQQVKTRVLEAAATLNYKPNYWARTLAIKKTKMIGLNFLSDEHQFSQFHLSLINGVLSECYKSGYRLLINALSNEYQTDIEHLARDPIDGEILLDPSLDDQRIEERLRENLPVIVIGNPPSGLSESLSYVDNDNVEAARKLTSHLLKLGHEHISFINAPSQRTVSVDRRTGYEKAFVEAGMTYRDEWVISIPPEESSAEFGYTTATRLLKKEKCGAMITDNERCAMGVYHAAKEMGIRIPEDLSVASFSEESFVSRFSPPLTSVQLNGGHLGQAAARQLLAELKMEEAESTRSAGRIIVPTDFIQGASSAPIKINIR